jgi:hypothetical protein
MAGSDSSDTISPLRREKFAASDTSETFMKITHEVKNQPIIRPRQRVPYQKSPMPHFPDRRLFNSRRSAFAGSPESGHEPYGRGFE